jgi:hypothetical protein
MSCAERPASYAFKDIRNWTLVIEIWTLCQAASVSTLRSGLLQKSTAQGFSKAVAVAADGDDMALMEQAARTWPDSLTALEEHAAAVPNGGSQA